jgi:hypothetical protein
VSYWKDKTALVTGAGSGKDNLPTLPPVSWAPNLRRYLSELAGPPYPVDACVNDALDAVARNEGVIVIPARARLSWRLGRWFPGLVERLVVRAARAERHARG